MIEKVECDQCGLKVKLLADDVIADHGWTRYGERTECSYSGRKYSRHGGSFRVTQRGPDDKATEWVCNCRCGRVWVGPDHKSVEKPWSEHVESVEAAA